MPQSPWNLMHEKGQAAMMEPTFLTVGLTFPFCDFRQDAYRFPRDPS